jgi:hypothetical protein
MPCCLPSSTERSKDNCDHRRHIFLKPISPKLRSTTTGTAPWEWLPQSFPRDYGDRSCNHTSSQIQRSTPSVIAKVFKLIVTGSQPNPRQYLAIISGSSLVRRSAIACWSILPAIFSYAACLTIEGSRVLSCSRVQRTESSTLSYRLNKACHPDKPLPSA